MSLALCLDYDAVAFPGGKAVVFAQRGKHSSANIPEGG